MRKFNHRWYTMQWWKRRGSNHFVIPVGGLEYKKVGVLVVSLRGVNFRIWSCLGLHAKKYSNVF